MSTKSSQAAAPAVVLSPSADGNRGSFFRRAVLRALAPLQRGSLRLELPDGHVLQFGADAPGARPASLRVRHENFFRRCVLAGDIGFGEGYVAGEWDTPDIGAVIAWFLLNHENTPTLSGSARRRAHGWFLNTFRFGERIAHALRSNSRANAGRNIRAHYDLSNEFFALFLDRSMMYSCARWTDATPTLEDAQRAKNESLCRALRLTPDDHVLEIGTGWGGWALHAAATHGCRVTTTTISREQFDCARQRIADAGLADRIEVQLCDYRDLRGTYDKIVSIEMMEAIGHRYLPAFCATLDARLKRDGLVALQFITCPDARYAEFRRGVDFIQKHIFPGSLLLSLNRVNDLLSRAGGFVLHDVTDLGSNYVRTLRVWLARFDAQVEAVRALGFDARFVRQWRYYLAYCEAAFAMRNISAVQTLHTRANNLSLR